MLFVSGLFLRRTTLEAGRPDSQGRKSNDKSLSGNFWESVNECVFNDKGGAQSIALSGMEIGLLFLTSLFDNFLENCGIYGIN